MFISRVKSNVWGGNDKEGRTEVTGDTGCLEGNTSSFAGMANGGRQRGMKRYAKGNATHHGADRAAVGGCPASFCALIHTTSLQVS